MELTITNSTHVTVYDAKRRVVFDRYPEFGVGTRWQTEQGNNYMLAACDTQKNTVGLVNLDSGLLYSTPVVVENVYDITVAEAKKLFDLFVAWKFPRMVRTLEPGEYLRIYQDKKVIFDNTPIEIAKVGDHFIFDGEPYVLAMVGAREYCMICIQDGRRFTEPIKINDPIDEIMFKRLCYNYADEFKSAEFKFNIEET